MYGKSTGAHAQVQKLQNSAEALANGVPEQEIPYMRSMLDELNTRTEKAMESNGKRY